MMIIDAFISMALLGVRINMGKYCTNILSSLSYLKVQLIADFACAAFVMLLSALDIIRVPLSAYSDGVTLATGLPSGAFFVLAEIFVCKALNEGPTGPVSAIISFNAVLVSVLIWAITGIALSNV